MGECQQQKHTQHAPSTKTECDYHNGWIIKRSHTQKSHPKVVNPRDIAGERKKKKKKKKKKKMTVKIPMTDWQRTSALQRTRQANAETIHACHSNARFLRFLQLPPLHNRLSQKLDFFFWPRIKVKVIQNGTELYILIVTVCTWCLKAIIFINT